MAATSSGGSRLIALDGLRGLAALMVFVHHARLPGLESPTEGLDAGVLVFFALSGYLLYRPFLAGPVDLRSYFVRRIARIYPAYLVASVGIALLAGWTWYLEDPLALVLMSGTPIVVAWTLQLELAFYIALPVIARFVRTPAAVVAVAVVSMAWAVVTIAVVRATGGTPSTSDVGNLPSWLWAFTPGMLLAAVEQQRPGLRPPGWLAVVGVLLLGVSVAWNPEFGNLPAAAGSGCLLASLIGREVRGPVARLCLVAGALSYPVYLWHQAIMDGLGLHLSWPGAAIALVLTCAVAALSYRVVEAPAMTLGRRLSSRLSRSSAEPDGHRAPVSVSAQPAVAGSPDR